MKRFLTKQEGRGSTGQMLYVHTQGKMVELTMEQLTGNVWVFVQHGSGNQVRSGTCDDVRLVVEVISMMDGYLRLDWQLFWTIRM